MWSDEAIMEWGRKKREAFVGKPRGPMTNVELSRWWCRGLQGAIDRIEKQKRQYGPAAKQVLLDARDILQDLSKQDCPELDDFKNDMFILQGLLLLSKHLYKFKVKDHPALEKELRRLLTIIDNQR